MSGINALEVGVPCEYADLFGSNFDIKVRDHNGELHGGTLYWVKSFNGIPYARFQTMSTPEPSSPELTRVRIPGGAGCGLHQTSNIEVVTDTLVDWEVIDKAEGARYELGSNPSQVR